MVRQASGRYCLPSWWDDSFLSHHDDDPGKSDSHPFNEYRLAKIVWSGRGPAWSKALPWGGRDRGFESRRPDFLLLC